MKHINTPIVKIAGCYALGIVVAYCVPLSVLVAPYVLALLLLLSIVWKLGNKALYQTSYFGIVLFVTFFSIGFANFQLRTPAHTPHHFIPAITSDSIPFLQLKVSEILKPDTYNTKYVTTVLATNGKRTSGKVLLSIQKDSTAQTYSIDDMLLITGIPSEIPAPLNPHQFDYSKYLKALEIYHQIRIRSNEIICVERGNTTLKGIAERSRERIMIALNNTPLTANERAIIQALVLGQKRDISKDLQKKYAAAGAIHILAVSGLHVGIIYFIVLFLLKPIRYFKHGTIISSILIVLFLWCFAFVTGLSPSVTRAVTMFSLFALAETSRRKTSPINTLVLSFFFLLIYNPNWLFHVGFQLSYLAVFSILWIQPKLYGYWVPKNYIVHKLWSISTVTLAAQIGILPLSLYYFHQFPGLFFLTNIVVLPFLGILLGGGILIVLLATLDLLPDELALIFNTCVRWLNGFISWVASQEQFVVSNISFSEYKLIASYSLIIAVILLWKQFNFKRLIATLALIAIFISVVTWDLCRQRDNALVVFQKSRNTLIGVKNANNLTIYKSDTISAVNTYPVKSFATKTQSRIISEYSVPTYLTFQNKKILIIDSLGVYPKLKTIDIVVLTHSPKIHLNRLLDSLAPKLIIADGSNYKSYAARWKSTCQEKKIPFHNTSEKGAYYFKTID